jgi:hypothetical protein
LDENRAHGKEHPLNFSRRRFAGMFGASAVTGLGLARWHPAHARDAVPLRQTGPTLEFPGFDLAAGPIACPPPARVAVQEPAVVLRYRTERSLRHAFVAGNLVLRDEGRTLAEGVDYWVDRQRGLVRGLKEGPERKVEAAYEGAFERVDFVTADAAGRLALVRGTEVPRVAQQFEPAVAPPLRKMFRVYRTADACTLQPVHLFDGPARIDARDQYAAAIRRSREVLAPFIRDKLKPGARVRWGSYGDSISALGATADPRLNTLPNIHRDLDFYFWNYDEAAMAGVPRYNFKDLFPEDVAALRAIGYLNADGVDAYRMRHLKVSQHWRLIEWIKSRYRVAVAYRNWSIGGTNSTSSLKPDGLMHLSHPDRLAAVLDDGLDIVNIATGMNELGADFTYRNLLRIGTEFRKRGTVVIFCCPLRAHPLDPHPVAKWRKTCDDIERVARDLDSACVQTRLRFDDEALLGWIAPFELGAASATSHPGIKELAAAGDLAIDLFR